MDGYKKNSKKLVFQWPFRINNVTLSTFSAEKYTTDFYLVPARSLFVIFSLKIFSPHLNNVKFLLVTSS